MLTALSLNCYVSALAVMVIAGGYIPSNLLSDDMHLRVWSLGKARSARRSENTKKAPQP